MRLILPLIAAASALLASCSSDGLANGKAFAGIKSTFKRDTIGGYTRADIANMRMRDLNPLAKTPKLVQVKQSTLREIPRERMAFFKGFSWFGRKPVDYTPPTLPAGALAFDGSLLPAKNSSGAASMNFQDPQSDPTLAANNPAAELEDEENFSIE